MNITVVPLSEKVYQDLFSFEQYNWDYFAQTVGARPDTYRYYESFLCAQEDLLQEQANGDIAFFVIYQQDKLIGRINLRDIRDNNASLGYRICQSAVGKGIATLAVKKIIDIAIQMGIKRINAVVLETNYSSEKVLRKNEFEYSHTEDGDKSLNATIINLKHFYKLITL
ncbi:GNAT family N-acetyltransferase [Psychrobacter sp. B38]|uniref:GNAT family N-acetyltransferase n=1 Tax=Psychrobacter sp. B38 TaxID=3143538 RepID=UPI00320E13F5